MPSPIVLDTFLLEGQTPPVGLNESGHTANTGQTWSVGTVFEFGGDAQLVAAGQVKNTLGVIGDSVSFRDDQDQGRMWVATCTEQPDAAAE